MELAKRSRLLFVGDSITDAGRNYQAELAGWGSFGDGYVNLINGVTTSLLPEKEWMVINKGISGDTIVELAARWQKDVLALKPSCVTVMIGINDVWRHFDAVYRQSPLVSLSDFEETYRQLITQTLTSGISLILMSPFMFETRLDDPMRRLLQEYQGIVKQLSAEFDLCYVDVQDYVNACLKHQSSYALSSDRVHPATTPGHMVITKAWLDAIGFEWPERRP